MSQFEKVYRQYEFSELVRIALIATDWIVRRTRKRKALAAEMPRTGSAPSPGPLDGRRARADHCRMSEGPP
jgi:hypothetical protein